ncbi:MAG TPA: hypothetical protein VKZ79_05040 [Alphaproteobacteria bacterium]|nr:hypothetical protein [Alphaproteobacteria bacterium]
MDDTSWIIPGIFGLILTIGAATFVIHMLFEHVKAKRNRTYKTLEEHRSLNAGRLERSSRGAGTR